MIDAAKASLSEWSAAKSAQLAQGHGFRDRRGLVQQIQREAMTEAHRLAGVHSLSEQDEAELIAHGMSVVEVPEFRVR